MAQFHVSSLVIGPFRNPTHQIVRHLATHQVTTLCECTNIAAVRYNTPQNKTFAAIIIHTRIAQLRVSRFILLRDLLSYTKLEAYIVWRHHARVWLARTLYSINTEFHSKTTWFSLQMCVYKLVLSMFGSHDGIMYHYSTCDYNMEA